MKPLCVVMATLVLLQGAPLSRAAAAQEGQKLAIAVVDFTNTSGERQSDQTRESATQNARS